MALEKVFLRKDTKRNRHKRKYIYIEFNQSLKQLFFLLNILLGNKNSGHRG